MLKGSGGSSPEGAEIVFNPCGAHFSFSIISRMSSAVSSSVSWGSFSSVGVVNGGFLIKSLGINGFGTFNNWGVSSVSDEPLFIGRVFEEFPDLFLSSLHTDVGASWAVVDWHSSLEGHVEIFVVPASLEDKDDDHDVKDGKSDKDETEHLSTSESGDETSMAGFSTSVGNSGVGIDSDSHSNVTGNDGGR